MLLKHVPEKDFLKSSKNPTETSKLYREVLEIISSQSVLFSLVSISSQMMIFCRSFLKRKK